MNTETTAVLGVPFDSNSSFLRGPAQAPGRILAAFRSPSSNLWTETGLDLGSHPGWRFHGDLPAVKPENELAATERAVGELLDRGLKVLSLGGDHAVTYPIVRAHALRCPDFSILHLDAHPDLYDELDGSRFSHACPFARIKEDFPGIPITQAGIRTATGHQRKQAERFGVEMIEMKDIDRMHAISFAGPVYLSVDLDCLDPAFAPGVSHHEPGGMSTRELITLIQNCPGRFIGADIVEYNPERDPQGLTAAVAAKLLKEILGRMISDSG